jgi:hypothetical protein
MTKTNQKEDEVLKRMLRTPPKPNKKTQPSKAKPRESQSK